MSSAPKITVLGVDLGQRTVFTETLSHGTDPRTTAWDHGYAVERPVAAVRGADGGIELRLLVRPVTGESRPARAVRRQDSTLAPEELAGSKRRQRVAAYALVRSSAGLLATEFSNRTGAAGQWGLPGGGIEDHEQPAEAVLREIAEETQQQVELGDLLEVQTSHWVGRSPRGSIEDYHAVRLVGLATCPEPTEPAVADVGGTTESARWVPLDRWSELSWTVGWRQILQAQLGAAGTES